MTTTPPPAQRPIGSADEPIRAIAFASGGFDTAMDLGVVHALLVMQGKAPHAVVGISAGAINAVALAEILQSEGAENSPAAHPRDKQCAQVARFRELLEAYANAPAELAAAYLPDTLQVEAGRSLEPLRLPIHNQAERDGRDEQLHARQGFVRLFNFLLRTQLTFATLTKFVRRFLGLRAAGQLRSRSARITIYTLELIRSWSLIGANLHRIAELMLETVWRPLFRAGARRPGVSAARVLFARPWVGGAMKAGEYSLMYLALTALWLTVTGLAAFTIWMSIRWTMRLPIGWGIAVWGVLGALVSLVVLEFHRAGVWRQLTITERRPQLRLAFELMGVLLESVVLVALYLAIPVAVIGISVFVKAEFSIPDAWNPFKELVRTWWWVVPVLGIVPAAVAAVRFLGIKGDYRRRFLEQFDLANGLLSKHPLRDMYVRLFDPGYYGPRNMDDVVERSLRSEDKASNTRPVQKLIRDYATGGHAEPIEVGLVVANVGTGELEVVDDGASVVDGLYAATAVTPLLEPASMPGRLYVDGANITSEPTAGVLQLLRGRTHPEAPVVHIYSVSPLPFSSPTLRDDEGVEAPIFLNLVDVARRAMLLQRFRDASLQRRLTELYTRSLRPGKAACKVGTESYLRAWVTPVEPDQPLELHQRLFDAHTKEAKRDAITEAVAEGCRAALQVMIRGTGDEAIVPAKREEWMPCRAAVETYFLKTGVQPLPLLANLDEVNPPPNQEQSGLPEVCAHCHACKKQPDHTTTILNNQLHFRDWEETGPAWPHQSVPVKKLVGDPHFRRVTTEYAERTTQALEHYKKSLDRGRDQQPRWPFDRNGESGRERPLVSLLFSGGVFRGVYQLGTLNALSELGLTPDVVAGASVGSITSAMIAQTLSYKGGERRLRIARLAASYLALDRLILTDRFADFVRGLTLRAGSTRFSLSQADGFFRRYDTPAPGQFNRAARRVMAGLERLFWLSPFELQRLVRALRLGDSRNVSRQLKEYVQEWLERMGVGREMLGSEPLALLIEEHVLQPLPTTAGRFDPYAEPFDRFLSEGIYFLATTTNLSMGRLEVLGEQQFSPLGPRANLLEGLLASSAFPAVFRPRWSWEVMPGSNVRHQYIDGGVMDNLPLDAVAHFLGDAAAAGLISDKPSHGGKEVPHLLFSASLEADVKRHDDVTRLDEFRGDWPALTKRAGKLRYNKKVELYAETQRALRAIRKADCASETFCPIDLDVLTVKPKWLVGTFAFHPMLGFRRDTQAESIAHGCATTLAIFADLKADRERKPWLEAWGVTLEEVPDPVTRKDDELVPNPGVEKGSCWFRSGHPCPFSRQRLETLPSPGLPPTTVTELDRIYQACGKAATHQARD